MASNRAPARIDQRSVVLDQAFDGLPGEIEAVEARVPAFEERDHADRLGIVVEAAEVRHFGIERALARVTEGRMAEIMGERQGLGEVLVEPERPGDCARDLRHFQRVGESGAVVVALVDQEDLGLLAQAPERCRMKYAVAVALEFGAGRARRLGFEPAAAFPRIGGIGRALCTAEANAFGHHWQSVRFRRN